VLSKIYDKLKEKGIRLIGIGTDYGAENFVETGLWKAEFFISPNYEIYKKIPNLRKVGLSGLASIFDIKKNMDKVKLLKTEIGEETLNNLPSNLRGTDPFYGGTFVIGPGNVLHYAYYDTLAIDWAPNSDILKACGIESENEEKEEEKKEEKKELEENQ